MNQMNIESLVKKFLQEEKFTLRNALAYAGLGLSKTGGHIGSVVTDIVFNGHQYNEERKKRVAEDLGEMMFYWHVLASSVDISPDEIIQQFISLYLIKNQQMSQEMQASIVDLLKHVKTDVKGHDNKIDEAKKRKAAALLLELQNFQNLKDN